MMKQVFSNEEAIAESERCLHCDCRKIDTCNLKKIFMKSIEQIPIDINQKEEFLIGNSNIMILYMSPVNVLIVAFVYRSQQN